MAATGSLRLRSGNYVRVPVNLYASAPAIGRLGNLMLVNGEPRYTLQAQQGEVVRFYVTNTANTRVFNIRMLGAQIKLVGSDSGRSEREELANEVLLAPSERAVIDVLTGSAAWS